MANDHQLNDFKKLMSARFLFTFAVQMQAVVIGWRMYGLTHDPLYLGLIGLSEAIPAISIALFSGYIVDRSRPLLIYTRVIEGSLLSASVLFYSQLSAVALPVHQQVIALFISSVITGAARGFSQPSVFAAVPRLVPREDLPRASAWMTTSMQVARIAGPALGGIFFGWLGMTITSGFVCSFLILGIGSMKLIQTSLPPPPLPARQGPLKDEILSGVRFVFNHRILLPALSLDMVSVLFGGVTAILPIYASDILLIGPKGLGVLRATPAIGAAITGYWLTRGDIQARAGRWLLTSIGGFGVCILVFAISRNFALSLCALGLSGAFDSVSMVVRGAAVQLASPDSMRGRISAVNSIFIGSSNEIGEFESGLAAKILGTVPSVIFGGVVCLVTVTLASVLSPALRKLDLRELKAE